MILGAKEDQPSTEQLFAGIRTGVDILEIARVENLLQRRNKSSLKRLFTDEEIKQSNNNPGILAGKFAAKEAVAKAIGEGFGLIKWIDLEIITGDKGEPILHLYNTAQDLSDELDISGWAISISHTNNIALAVAIAVKSDTFLMADSLSIVTDNIIRRITEKIGEVEAIR